jgi:PilZ domain
MSGVSVFRIAATHTAMPIPASCFRSKISTSERTYLSQQGLRCCRFRCEQANDLVVDRRNISRRRGYRDACLVVLSQKDQIRAALRGPEQQRKEPRTPRQVALENVSRHGARVVTNRRWYPHDSVLVRLPDDVLPARARITYCQPLKGDMFAMGLQFSLAVYSWIGSPQYATHSD